MKHGKRFADAAWQNRIPYSILIGALLNALLNGLANLIKLPIFLDSVFTVAVAALFGAVPGIATGILTNLFMELFNGFPGTNWPFAAVSAITALIVALAASRGWFSSVTGIFWAIALLSVSNAFAGALIVFFVFGGFTNVPMDSIVRTLMVTGESLFNSALLGRIFINAVDKSIAVLAMLAILSRYHWLESHRILPGNPR